MQSYANCSWTLTFNQSFFSFSCKCVMIYAIFVSTWQIVVFHFLGFAFLWTSSILAIGFLSVTRNVFVQNLKPLCCNILLYGTQTSCLAITPSPNMYLWQYTCRQYVLRAVVATLWTFAIYNLPSWPLVKKKNRQVTYTDHIKFQPPILFHTRAVKPPWQPAILEKKKGWWTLCKDPFQGAIHPESQIIHLTRRVGS